MPTLDYNKARATTNPETGAAFTDSEIRDYATRRGATLLNAPPTIGPRETDRLDERPTSLGDAASKLATGVFRTSLPGLAIDAMRARGGEQPVSVDRVRGEIARKTHELPLAAGVSGGVIGSVPGATIGGAVGRVGERAINAAFDIPTETNPSEIVDVGVPAVSMGAMEMGGRGAGSAIAKAAEPLARQALKVPESLEMRFPKFDWIKNFFQEGRPVSAGSPGRGNGSAGEFKKEMLASGRNADALIGAADAATTTHSLQVPTTTFQTIHKPVTTTTPTLVAPPAFTHGVGDVASAALRDQEATSLLADVASSHGYATDELVSLLRDPNPRPLDLAKAFDRGLTPNVLAKLREVVPNVGAQADVSGVTHPVMNNVTQTRFVPQSVPVPGPNQRVDITLPKRRYLASESVAGVPGLLSDMAESTTRGPDQSEIAALRDAYVREHPGWRTAAQVQKAKQFAGTAAERTIQQSAAGERVVASAPNVKLFDESVRGRNKAMLEADIPGLGEVNKVTQGKKAMMLAHRIASRAKAPPISVDPLGAIRWYLAGGPGGASRMALAANNPAVQQAPANVLRLLASGYYRATEPDATVAGR